MRQHLKKASSMRFSGCRQQPYAVVSAVAHNPICLCLSFSFGCYFMYCSLDQFLASSGLSLLASASGFRGSSGWIFGGSGHGGEIHETVATGVQRRGQESGGRNGKIHQIALETFSVGTGTPSLSHMSERLNAFSSAPGMRGY